jgi:hypothetical protein
VDWEFVDWNGVDLLLDDDWVTVRRETVNDSKSQRKFAINLRNLDWDFDWVRNLNFLYDWNFHDLVFWHLLVVMLVDGVNWNFDASDVMFTASATAATSGNWNCTRSCRQNDDQTDLKFNEQQNFRLLIGQNTYKEAQTYTQSCHYAKIQNFTSKRKNFL